METVRLFYEENAEAFSKTRNFPWPNTRTFLSSLPSHTRILDVGCGNGRNMFYRNDIQVVGIELSHKLCEIVRQRGGSVVNGSMTSIPFHANTFDAVMAIASYHHLYHSQDRKQAILEMSRVLKPNGLLNIHVWAMEQPPRSKRRFTQSNEIVSWKNKDGKQFDRYYHIYRKGELEREILEYSGNMLELESMDYEEGNWIGIFRKIY